MLRSEPLFYNMTPRVAYPGIPAGASNLGEALTLIQDVDTFTSELNLLKLALLRVGGYLTPSDDARDLTHRLYYFLRFSGCSTQLIAERIQTATDSITKGEEDSITPQAFCDGFGALAPMAPLTDLPVTDFQVGKAQAGVITPFLPQDYYDYVDTVFKQFTLEHRAAVLDVHDPSDYPTFHHLVDEDELVSYAFSMLQEGNKLRKQVKALVKAETATRTPTGKNKKKTKKTKQPSPSTTSGSDSSSSPSPDKRNNRQKKNAKRTKKQPAKRSKSTNQDEEKAERQAENDRQRGLPDGHPDLDSYQIGLRAWLKSDASMDNSVPPRPRCYRQATSGNCTSRHCRRSHEPAV